MRYKLYMLVFCFVAISTTAYSQNDTSFLSRAVDVFLRQSVTHPIEKVYLHLDKPRYYLKDTIWFKAYTVIGDQHKLSALSGVLYVELINNKDSVVKRLTLAINSGLAWGNINLPRSYKPGLYHIRAYTNWMRNAGPDYFYNQPVGIGDVQSSVNMVKQNVTNPDVQFFPEGGSLVAGLRSKIAVKAVRPNGLGEDIRGVVTDNDGHEITTFSTQHLGMGIFAFTPQQNKTYQVKITTADSAVFTAGLPKAEAEGYTLGVNNRKQDSIYVKVAVNDKLFDKQKNAVFYLIAQSQGKVYYTATSKLVSPVFESAIAKNRFPTGIVQFTLFSQNGEPLNERIAFIQNDDALKLKISAPAETYTTRMKVSLSMDAMESGQQPVIGSFSVAVINKSLVGVNESAESTIFNNLLLTSDLKGHIEKPNYYFSDSLQAKADLDVLMLTQGYREFKWKALLSDTVTAVRYQPERSLEMDGTLKTPSGQPIPNGQITLVAPRENFLMDTTTDINGNFKFTNLHLSDTSKTILRARKANKGSNVAIYVKQKDYPPVIKEKTTQNQLDEAPEIGALMQKNDEAYQKQLKDDSIKNGIKLNGVTIKSTKISKPDIYNNYGVRLEYDADMSKLTREYPNLKDGLTAVIPGLSYIGDKIAYHFHPVSIIIDGFPHSADDLNVSPAELESVRLIDSRPALLVINTKSYAGTDTVSTVKLKEVNIRTSKINSKPDLSNSSNLQGGGNADQVIMGDKLDGCITLSDCLNGKVFGVTFGPDGTPKSMRAQNHLGAAPSMVLIVDGIVLPGSRLNDLNAADIYSIEVLRSAGYLAVYGSTAPGGALIITTKRGGEANYVTSETPAGLITYPFNGFYKARRFYSPKYDGPNINAAKPDLRTTIYWNPNIITNKDGNAAFDYFNADTKGDYRVVIEGIDDKGHLGRAVYEYTVK